MSVLEFVCQSVFGNFLEVSAPSVLSRIEPVSMLDFNPRKWKLDQPNLLEDCNGKMSLRELYLERT